jgi:queuine tRNA-ribosyltransferase
MQFGIVQGGTYDDLRARSAEAIVSMGFEGHAIGGLAVGEEAAEMYRIVDNVIPRLPGARPRYLMGVGTPENLIEAVARGVDMFDCVLPTRNGRNGQVFTSAGTLNLRNAVHRDDERPLDGSCPCSTCGRYSRAYLRHLFMAKEVLGLHLATIHNLTFYQNLMRDMRAAIIEGRFAAWKMSTLSGMSNEIAAPN